MTASPVSEITLADAGRGSVRCVDVLAEGQNAVRLKRLGICEDRTFDVLGAGDPMVLRIGDSQVGLSRQLARLVRIESLS